MFLHYLTLHKNWNATLTRWIIDTWDRNPQSIIDKAIDQWQTRLRACVKAKRRHFEHQLWPRHTTDSFQSHNYTPKPFFSETLTLLRGKQHCVFGFVYSVMSGSIETTKARWQIIYAFKVCHVLNFIAIDLQLYKIFKITRISFSGHSVVLSHAQNYIL